jgi:hypothetical protein
LGNEDDGENSPAIMRVMVADADTEMLEAVARTFDVDVATSKATSIDLLRANEFDVIVACERLTDGSGLELLSHVGQRWPNVVRILAIEPERRALLKGRLGPFKLFETVAYPIDTSKLEATLTRAAEAIAVRDADPRSSLSRGAAATRNATSGRDTPAARATPKEDARSAAARTAQAPTSPSSRQPATVAQPSQRMPSATRAGAKPPAYPPLPARGTKIVPLGSAGAPEYKIVRQDFRDQTVPGAARGERDSGDGEKNPTLQKKAASLAAGAMAAMARMIKPQSSTPPEPPPKAPPRKKR